MKKITFIDFTSNLRYDEIQDRAIGGSEFQLYNLIYNISKWNNLICYNKIEKEYQSENIIYKNLKELENNNFNTDDIIIIQRLFPEINLLKKFSNCKIIIFIHDYDFNAVLFQFQKSYDDKKEMLHYVNTNENLNFVFNSEFTQNYFNSHFLSNNMFINKTRQHVIYNILYEEYFIRANKKVNKKNLVYASGWNKGILQIIHIFDFILKQDPSFKLILMSPGYEYDKFKDYTLYLKEKYKNNIIILGPVNKIQYCKIIENAGCVLAPAFPETFGCVFAEAYFLGTPVICDVKSGAVKEIIGYENVVNYSNLNETYDKIISKINIDEKIELNEKFKFDYNFNLWKTVLL
jgi:glycosyltransferase involved in cell wall biosynthesis